MRKTLYLSLLVLALLGVRDWSRRDIAHPPGVLVPELPQQTGVTDKQLLWLDEYRLTRRAKLSLRARVLSTENYYIGREAELSPVDLALGWGPMSDQAVLDRISIRQSGRWYFTRYEQSPPIPDAAIISNSSNMHMIPANRWVESKLDDIRGGDLVQMKGYLVDVDHQSGFKWRTSLRRDDTGNGSCEIYYLEEIFIESR